MYAEMCERIRSRCYLLMRVSPVPIAVATAPAVPTLTRTPSTEAHDAKSVDEAAIHAWLTSQEAAVPLATASPDHRFTMVWKYVFSPLDLVSQPHIHPVPAVACCLARSVATCQALLRYP